MERLVKYDLEAVLHVEFKPDFFMQKVAVTEKAFFVF